MLDANGKPIKRKQAVLETRKSIGKKPKKYEDDSEDDFQPTKAKVKAKPKAGSSKIKYEDDDFDDPPAKEPPRKRVPVKKEESHSETEVAPQAKGKKAITKKEDSDFELDDDAVLRKVAPKPKKRVISKKESDSDVETLGQLGPKGKGKEKEQRSGKRKRYSRSVPTVLEANHFFHSSEQPGHENGDAPVRPAKVKKETSQSSVTDFFTKPETVKKAAGSRTVPGSKSKARPVAKKAADSEEEGDKSEDSDIPPPPPRRPTARAAASAKKYVEIPSDDEGMEDDSMYQDD